MRNFKIPDNFPKEIINESSGRPSLPGKRESLEDEDEDEEFIKKNDKYVKPEDIADNSYLSYGEDNAEDDDEDLDEENYMLTDEEIEKDVREKEKALSLKKQLELEWAKNHPEAKLPINRDVVHSNDNRLSEGLNGNSDTRILNEEEFDARPPSRSMRFGVGPDFYYERGMNKTKSPHDNLKTLLPAKKKKRNRGLLRGLFKS